MHSNVLRTPLYATVFMDMEKMLGPDFERGLAGLDAASSDTAARGGE